MSASILSLASTRRRKLSQAHADYVSAAIAQYKEKARRALQAAQEARQRGELLLWSGLIDEAITHQAMADGLLELHTHTNTAGEPR